jgi:hypothetical protein
VNSLYSNQDLLAIAIGASFAAGVNVYATVAVLGLLARFDMFSLPPQLAMLENWVIIGIAGAMFALEFVADKIPGFDLIWNALQTFVRVPVAGLITFAAASNLTPGAQLATASLASVIALASHGGKMALRTVVTPSPEPLSNIGLSLAEDVAAIGLTWFATQHPYWAALIVAVLLVFVVVVVRLVWRTMGRLFRGARAQWARWQGAG